MIYSDLVYHKDIYTNITAVSNKLERLTVLWVTIEQTAIIVNCIELFYSIQYTNI